MTGRESAYKGDNKNVGGSRKQIRLFQEGKERQLPQSTGVRSCVIKTSLGKGGGWYVCVRLRAGSGR